MESIILYFNKREEAQQVAMVLCDFIKANEKYDHQLYFARRFMGSFTISLGEEVNGEKKLIGNREVVIFPNNGHTDKYLEGLSKDVIMCKNCMSIVGDSDKKHKLLEDICDWVVGEDVIFEKEVNGNG